MEYPEGRLLWRISDVFHDSVVQNTELRSPFAEFIGRRCGADAVQGRFRLSNDRAVRRRQ